MVKTLIIPAMVGNAATDILHREVNSLCIDKKLDGDAIWKEIMNAPDILLIQEILDKHFGKELKII